MLKVKNAVSLCFVCFLFLLNMNVKAQQKKSGASKNAKTDISQFAYEKYIDDHHQSHIKEFIELVSIPSISSIPSHKADVEKAAAWIVNKLNAIGMTTTKQIQPQGNPVVYGSWDKAPGKPTTRANRQGPTQTPTYQTTLARTKGRILPDRQS